MSNNLRSAAQRISDEVKLWSFTTLSDGGIVVYKDGEARAIFHKADDFSTLYDAMTEISRIMDEPVVPPSTRGAPINNGFASAYDEILEKNGDWVVREGLSVSHARSLKRSLRNASDVIAVSLRTTPEGITLYARLVTSGTSREA